MILTVNHKNFNGKKMRCYLYISIMVDKDRNLTGKVQRSSRNFFQYIFSSSPLSVYSFHCLDEALLYPRRC